MGNKGLDNESIDKHPSYGMVGINRTSSSGTYLFGSIMKHHSFITLRIQRASMRRHLAYDRPSAEGRTLIEIEMSHTQFGEMITGHGMGDGVPCTIRAFDGDLVGECPQPESLDSKFSGDLKATTKETVAGLKQLTQQLSQSLLPGEKALNKTELKTLLGQIQSALNSITDSIPFIEKQFNEEMEGQMNKAKGELEAVVGHLIHNTGLKAIAAQQNALPEFPTPQLTEGKKK